jgi:hypothetical protein
MPDDPGAFADAVRPLVEATRAAGRGGTTSEIAYARFLLVSEKDRWFSGQQVSASGGMLAKVGLGWPMLVG